MKLEQFLLILEINPEEIKSIHCVLYEIARAMIYIMILKMSDADNKSIKTIISKLF